MVKVMVIDLLMSMTWIFTSDFDADDLSFRREPFWFVFIWLPSVWRCNEGFEISSLNHHQIWSLAIPYRPR